MKYDHIFDSLEIETKPFALCEIAGVRKVALPADGAVTLHYVLSGEGNVIMPRRAAISISPGSLILVPALVQHEIRSTATGTIPAPACQPAELELRHVLTKGGPDEAEQAPLLALCAHIVIGLKGSGNLIDLLHDPLHMHISQQHPLFGGLKTLLGELSRPDLGSRAMVRAILLQAVIEMLRQRMAMGDGALHWMAALRDPAVWKALKAMLDAPQARHSVESLSELAGMSRSCFAKRFSQAYGSGPMELLRDLRMRKAGRLLSETDKPVKAIAAEVGFASRSAFSRQFELATGQSPRSFRTALKDR
ncbi:AraC family transcriptional regulator [Shimia marina]|uniref:Chb operon repressor n=2 Tax=Shimia marina TaxID=321267 RepID=A0A0N7LRW4_9RHOB|nr:AraC family transcriptional regulator [Shimia marina]CUH51948.1 Chb operon repressor [Shimia marina]SFE44912.1 Cupin [Shimia marina]